MSDTTGDDMIDGTCAWCSDETRVFPDNNYCEECDIDIFHCAICDEDQHANDTCRHLFQTDNFEWHGSGAGVQAFVKPALFRLLDAMPKFFAFDLKRAILSGGFYTFLSAPVIGGGGPLSLYGWPGRPSMSYVYGQKLIELGGSDRAKRVSDGYHWLASLYETDTREANAATVKWIDEWIGS